jgi:hypothetical protein
VGGVSMVKVCVVVLWVGVVWCWGKICCSCLWCTSIKAAMSVMLFASAVMAKNAISMILFRGYFVLFFCFRFAWFVSFRFSSIVFMCVCFCCIVCDVLCLLVMNVT